MAEIISGIQIIKLYAWEKPFAKMVNIVRTQEINIITWKSFQQGVFSCSFSFVEKAVLAVTLITYALFGHTLTAQKVFTVAQYYYILQITMSVYFPNATTSGAEVLGSIKRLEKFLLLEERNDPVIELNTRKSVIMKNVRASWDQRSHLLDNIDIHVPSRSLCVIVGAVGAGKSSIFQLLLGELHPEQGVIEVGGELSYSSQEPWLFSSTIRQNILFGQRYDGERYERVIKSCALERDLLALPHGDQSLVGEKGVVLSGGQKARINLARAVYRNADIYLLDDPLSAVDTHVGNHLFEECILGYLKNKTRILITHQLQYLQKADHLVVLNNGTIEAQGTFGDLSKTNLDFTKLIAPIIKNTVKEEMEMSSPGNIVTEKQSIVSSPTFKDLDKEEMSEYGEKSPLNMRRLAYREYAQAGGNIVVLSGVLLFAVCSQVLLTSIDFWMAYWVKCESAHFFWEHLSKPCNSSDILELRVTGTRANNNSKYICYSELEPKETNRCDDWFDRSFTIHVYIGLICLFPVFMTIRSLYFFKVAMNASKNLHNKIFYSLLQAPMRFFDINPTGRILNRFSSDMGIIDEALPTFLLETLGVILMIFGAFVMIFIINSYMIAIALLLGTFVYKTQRWSFQIAGNVKHLEGITRSPVFTHINDSLNGITTIRASSSEPVLIQEFDWHQDTHTSAWHLMLNYTASFSILTEFTTFIFVVCVIISFIIMNQFGAVNSSMVGLALSQSLVLTGLIQYGTRIATEVITRMTSVERVIEYTTLDKEGPQETNGDQVCLKTWPSEGSIKFHQIYLRYSRHEGPVLKNVNFTVKDGEKIGIVGRTGAGKSSLIAALFRLVPTEGSITIDGVRIEIIGLNDLRRKISIIPQDPVLFSATLRYNLDPFEEYSDQELWRALETVKLRDVVESLDFVVEESGKNFSTGQKQLVCLARAILRENKILVMDEATANVDPKTDRLIQETIRTKFGKCTVLTIAHRLHTVMDSDRILVMDGGELVEFDKPLKLLENSNGYLYKMVAETGTQLTGKFYEVAEKFTDSKNLKEDSVDTYL